MKGAAALRRAVATTTLEMGTTNVTTAAWATLLAAASNMNACSGLEIFNPSGSAMQIATGAAGSETTLPYTILPGGTTGFLAIEIPSGTRISLKAIDTNVAAGLFVLNQFG